MMRSVLDFLYAWRILPWLVMLLLIPPHLVPASYWFEVRSIEVSSGKEPVLMIVDRTIVRPFRGDWNTTVRWWSGKGWETWCTAEGTAHYSTEAVLPSPLTVRWWTGNQCALMGPGRYKMTTSWTIWTPAWMPDKTVSVESNTFEVTN